MASVERFEDLYTWKLARKLVNAIYDLTERTTFKDFSLKDQIQRAAISVLSNVAEGFERGSKDEFLYFLYVAKGSCGKESSADRFLKELAEKYPIPVRAGV